MKLKFGGQLIGPDVRRLYDLRDVAFDTAWFEAAPDRDAYYMYRDLALSLTDAEAITRHQLRYDITIIPPFNMGLECVKTYGHYHPRVNPKLRYAYPEIYEVLDGDAHYLLQRAQNDQSVDEVILVKATRGDKVIVPPNYGHVTINPSDRTLKMANWVCRSFDSVYEPTRSSAVPHTMSSSTVGYCTTERTTTCLRSGSPTRQRCPTRADKAKTDV